MAKVVGSWEGGRVIEKSDGVRVYYIRKRMHGRLWEVSTGATRLRAALAQLERFQANPAAYTPSGEPRGRALTVDAHLDDYLAWCVERGNSPNWKYQKRRYLAWWAKRCPNDVRSLTRERVLAELEGISAPHNRLAALKAFCSWLREAKGLLSRVEDVTMDIPIPAPRPAQWTLPRAITREVFRATLDAVDPGFRDVLVVLGATGMHTTECLRLAQGKGSVAGNVVTIFHKGGRQHRMEVEPHVAEAAARLQKRGGFSISRLMKGIKNACDTAGVERWAPGALRHSVATWLVGDGVPLDTVATYLNHDVATLKKFYSVAVIPLPRHATAS